MTTRRALVTGANGFIGANLTRRLLNDGFDVAVLVRPGSNRWRLDDIERDMVIHEVDIRDGAGVARAVAVANADWLFHLAAHGGSSWQTAMRDIVETNLLGAMSVIDASLATDFDACVVAGSSSE